jgi:adenine-specific DNA-methyltransferase
MATKKTPKPEARTEDYLHQNVTRPNNPEAGHHSFDKVKVPPKVKYQYDPHLDPQLVWASKAERTEIEVDTVSLHKHEVIRPQDIVSLVQDEPVQLGLFGDQRLPITKAVEFYKHDQLWMNRMVLGDSLLVMNSLLHKENLGGHVQMIYIDPPYGIAYNSNFQPRVDKREVQDGKDDSLSREPEQIKAYRDTWTLGVHSYLSYLRDRLTVARELLHESGSVFVQISEDNVHHVRELLDEVFGSKNFVSFITFSKTSGRTDDALASVSDYLLWYAKSREKVKYRQLYLEKEGGDAGAGVYSILRLPDNSTRRMTASERRDPSSIPVGARIFRIDNLTSQSIGREKGIGAASWFGVKVGDKEYFPNSRSRWKTNEDGMRRLVEAGRVAPAGISLGYVRYLDDFPFQPLTNSWSDTGTGSFTDEKTYVVQTGIKVIQRCLLMTTDPGDLVLDPTCGSGTTAYVAEQWGRRWITCDTSRVALSLARQRLMTSAFPFYELAHPKEGVAGGFKYKEVPHVTLREIAQNLAPETEKIFDQPNEKKHITRVAGPFSVEAISALDPSEAMTPAPSVTNVVPQRPADRVQQLFDVLAKDGGLSVAGKGRIEIEGLRRVMDLDGIDAEGEITVDQKKLRLAVAFGPYHGPVTANRLEEAISAATGQYQALAVAGFSFDPEVSAFLDKHPMLSVQLFRVQIAPDVQIGDLLKVKHAEKLFSVLGQPDFAVVKDGAKYTVTLKGVDLYDPNTRLVKAHQVDDVAAWFLDPDYDGRCFRVRQVFLPAEQGKGFEKLQKSLKAIIDEDAWDALKGFTSMPFELGNYKTVAVKVINVFGHEVIGVRKVKA